MRMLAIWLMFALIYTRTAHISHPIAYREQQQRRAIMLVNRQEFVRQRRRQKKNKYWMRTTNVCVHCERRPSWLRAEHRDLFDAECINTKTYFNCFASWFHYDRCDPIMECGTEKHAPKVIYKFAQIIFDEICIFSPFAIRKQTSRQKNPDFFLSRLINPILDWGDAKK